MAKALELAAAAGHVCLVEAVEGLFLDEARTFELDIPNFAAMIEKLVLDPFSYKPATVRLLLNLALSQERGL